MTLINITPSDRRATAYLTGQDAPRSRALGATGVVREAVAPLQNALAEVADLALLGGRSDTEVGRLLSDITCRRAMLEEALTEAGLLLERRGARVPA